MVVDENSSGSTPQYVFSQTVLIDSPRTGDDRITKSARLLCANQHSAFSFFSVSRPLFRPQDGTKMKKQKRADSADWSSTRADSNPSSPLGIVLSVKHSTRVLGYSRARSKYEPVTFWRECSSTGDVGKVGNAQK